MRVDWPSARHSPIEAVRKISRSLKVIGARMVRRIFSAKAMMRPGSRSDSRISANWSPESRASVSCGLSRRVEAARQRQQDRSRRPPCRPNR